MTTIGWLVGAVLLITLGAAITFLFTFRHTGNERYLFYTQLCLIFLMIENAGLQFFGEKSVPFAIFFLGMTCMLGFIAWRTWNRLKYSKYCSSEMGK